MIEEEMEYGKGVWSSKGAENEDYDEKMKKNDLNIKWFVGIELGLEDLIDRIIAVDRICFKSSVKVDPIKIIINCFSILSSFLKNSKRLI